MGMRTLPRVCLALAAALWLADAFALATSAIAGVVDPNRPVTNGRVYAIAATPSTVYVGGDFTRVGAPTGTSVSLSAATGALVAAPRVNGTVEVVVPDGLGGWYVGGNFSKAGGQARQNLAHIV